jgi:hypothetical protein
MFHPEIDGGDLPIRSGCPAAKMVASEITGEKTLL